MLTLALVACEVAAECRDAGVGDLRQTRRALRTGRTLQACRACGSCRSRSTGRPCGSLWAGRALCPSRPRPATRASHATRKHHLSLPARALATGTSLDVVARFRVALKLDTESRRLGRLRAGESGRDEQHEKQPAHNEHLVHEPNPLVGHALDVGPLFEAAVTLQSLQSENHDRHGRARYACSGNARRPSRTTGIASVSQSDGVNAPARSLAGPSCARTAARSCGRGRPRSRTRRRA